MPITAGHIAPQGGGFEPQRTYDFDVELYGVPGAGDIELSVQSSNIPTPEVGAIEINMGAERRKVAGQANVPDGEIVVVDYIDRAILSSLLEWQRLVYDPDTGLLGLASSYKKEGAIVMVGPDGQSQRIYRLKGVWPTRVSPDNLDYTNESVLTVTMSLSIDVAVKGF